MSIPRLLVAILSLGASLSAQQTIDVNQPSAPACVAGTWQDHLAQSFQPVASNCAGAGFYMWPAFGITDNIEIKLCDGIPYYGGTVLASGNADVGPGQWVDVFWAPVPLVPGNTYYLLIGANNASMCLAGDLNNPYPGGMVFANAGYQAYPNFDYAFRTWTQDGPGLAILGQCPNVDIDIHNGTPFGSVAIASSPSLGSFTIPGGSCSGVQLGIANPTLRLIRSLDGAGAMTYGVTLPAGACGSLHLQAVDLSACKATNVADL